MIMTICVAHLLLSSQGPTAIQSYIQTDLHDMSFVAHVVKGNQAELKKINSDFGMAYRFPTTSFKFKEPFKLRLDATIEDSKAHYIFNGPIQSFRFGSFSSRQNLATKPGRRQTAMDLGVLTPSLFEELFVAKFVRMDRETGDAVFDLTYNPTLKDKSRSRVWLDPQKKYITKREWFNQFDRQLATFYYENPRETSGVWLPTKLTVKNTDDVVAGITAYDSISVNTGLPDSLFEGLAAFKCRLAERHVAGGMLYALN